MNFKVSRSQEDSGEETLSRENRRSREQETTNYSVSQTSPATSVEGGAEQGNANGTDSGAASDTEDANETSEATPLGAYLAPSATVPRKKKEHDVIEAVSMPKTSSRRYDVLMGIVLVYFLPASFWGWLSVFDPRRNRQIYEFRLPPVPRRPCRLYQALLQPIWNLHRLLPMLQHPPISPW
jgi:hypothetical protein